MSEQPNGPGATSGLPGENADPRTSEITEDERDDSVSMADVAPPDADGQGDSGR